LFPSCRQPRPRSGREINDAPPPTLPVTKAYGNFRFRDWVFYSRRGDDVEPERGRSESRTGYVHRSGERRRRRRTEKTVGHENVKRPRGRSSHDGDHSYNSPAWRGDKYARTAIRAGNETFILKYEWKSRINLFLHHPPPKSNRSTVLSLITSVVAAEKPPVRRFDSITTCPRF